MPLNIKKLTKKEIIITSITITSLSFLVWSIAMASKFFANPAFSVFWWLNLEQANAITYPALIISCMLTLIILVPVNQLRIAKKQASGKMNNY
jgi:hypothetical protein